MKSAAEISLVPVLTAAGGDVVLVSCPLLTINIMPVYLSRLSESSVLTDDLLKRERNGRRERGED